MADEQKDPIAEYDEMLGARPYAVAPGVVFMVEPMMPADWGEIIGAIPVLGNGSTPAAQSRDNLARQQAMYKKIYETKVQGILGAGGSVTPRPYERVLAGHIQQLGEYVLEISGIGGARAEAAGRSLP